MIRRLLEAFFRHKVLLLLAPVLVPGIVTPIVLATAPTVYDSYITIWVDHPSYLNYNDGSNAWVTPAQVQINRLGELMRTRPFELDVARRTTTMAPLIGSTAGEARIDDYITHLVSLGRPGDHIMVVSVSAPTAKLSYELSTALVDAYQEKVQSDQADQSSLAIAYYQTRIQEAQQQVSKTGADLRRYLATQNGLGDTSSFDTTTTAPSTGAPAVSALLLDPKLASLTTAVQQAQSDVTGAQSALLAAQRDSAAALQGQQLGFQVLDQAKMPTAPTRALRKLIVYPIAALVTGLGLSAMLLVLFVAADRSARGESDLAPGLRLLGAVPALKVKRAPKKLRSIATRRAIGAAAGMALPVARGARS
jgi:uncharacterized protein involved in exopolysaccharide biosynthesis